MRRVEIIMSLFLMMGLLGCVEKEEKTNVITVDVTTTYPKKELVLQDLMDVEYIPLETNDEFITQGSVMAIGEKYILVKNWSHDGNIFVFDRKTGKGIRKINRKGQGDGEYSFINGIILDEDNNEMFVNCASTKKIYVYDLSGNFKRDFKHVEGGEYLEVFNYDKNNLICYDMSLYYKEGQPREENRSYHLIISKQDGSVTQKIYIPFDVIKTPVVQKGGAVAMTSIRSIIPYQKEWLLVETSSDTVYNYVPEKNQLNPFLIKSPTRDLEILLTMGVVTDRYCFMHTVKKDFDFTTGRGFLITDLMYDKQENAVFEANVLNGDFVEKQNVDMLSDPMNGDEIVAIQPLAANKIVDAYKNDGLKGKLKEIAAGLDEESNPVIMLVKNRE
ncbi:MULTISPECIES: 6-bladed beta-propeller [Bacteroides]|uniref:6-bladed beta-propeller n=2 Tax=Pseudomonadati TaxID=3379134 RepID=UPI00229D7AC0|nr:MULTISPECIES: 6-bladed beta-propeller [Bacteroides]MCY6344198.1 6-bladed beta-propeller [Bacteroides fragilis]MCZ2671968.1 6-bladed beta-propeller [Bacteroides fragilis]MDV6205096.1 6-bladed beta-propeller [Bacteroides hominis (ex Liu et al. 2022)]